jgi:predicted PurR-regulated permease PerM
MGNRVATGTAAHRAVLLAAALVAAALLFQQLMTLLLALLITIIVAIVASSLATRLERIRVPRVVGVFLALALLVRGFAGAFALVIPPVVDQVEQFIDDLPQIVDTAIERVAELTGAQPTAVGEELQSFLERYIEQPELLLGPLASVGMTALTILAGIVFILVSAFYMAVRPAPLVQGALRLLPPDRRPEAAAVMERLRGAWLGWLRGVAADMLVSFTLLYIGLSLVGMEFALLFSVLSAVLVVVPYFGAIAGGIPPVLFALTDSPEKALIVLAIYLAVQQVEGNLIVPLVMSQTVKLHPAVIAVGVVVVGALFGIVGLIVSVPLISTAVILTEELWVKPRERAAGAEVELPHDPELGPADTDAVRNFADRELAALPEADVERGPREDDSLSWDERRFLALLGLPAFALALAITTITTYLPVLLASLSGPAVIGLLIGSEGLIALFVPLIAGAGSDETRTRLGRRLPYLLVAAGALILMPLAGSLLALVLLLLLFYASDFTYYAPYYALYPDLVSDAVRGRTMPGTPPPTCCGSASRPPQRSWSAPAS